MIRRTLAPLLLLAAAAAPAAAAAAPAAAAAAPAPEAAPGAPLTSGLDLAGFDRSVRPADDLYRFVAGGWMQRNPIPPDRPSWSNFAALHARVEERLHALTEALAADPPRAGSNGRRIADFYMSLMDAPRRERLGGSPLAAERRRIASIADRGDLATYLGAAQHLGFTTTFGERVGLDAPIDYEVQADLRDSTRYVGYLSQAGLTLPDRDYYLLPQPQYRADRAALVAYARALLRLAGVPDAAGRARRILALETRLAGAQWSAVRNRDPQQLYNRMSAADLARLAPGLDWQRFLAALHASPRVLIVEQPDYLSALARLAAGTSLEDWKAYLEFKLLDGYAPYLSRDYVALHFGFHQHRLLGVPASPARWQLALGTLECTIGEALGQEYVARHFQPQAKARALVLIGNLLRAFAASIDELDWMSPATRHAAQEKLAKISVKIGYPDHWRDWSGLELSALDPVGNLLRSARFLRARDLARDGGTVDRTEWFRTPQTVDAYYYAPLNEIVFPAAILQPPFFDPEADDAVNYGAIGGAIGHEISHAFDDAGSRYDGEGNLRDWWTAEDAARFHARTAALVAEYSAFRVPGGQAVNGELTLGENIADLAGLAVAWRAWRLSLGDRASPVLDGYTGAQRFFLGWGQAWRLAIRDDALRAWLANNPHSPYEFRVNGVVTNLDGFHEAFGVVPGDKLYRPPGDRVKIW